MSAGRCEHVTQLKSPPEGVTLRVMKASDLPHVRALHRNLLPVSYPAAFFVQLLINPRRLCLVVTDGGAIIGFASAAMGPSLAQPTSGGGYIGETSTLADRKCSDIALSHITLLTLGVLPAYQRRGIGRSLVHGVVQRLEALCAADAPPMYDPTSSDHIPDQDSKVAVLVQVQVAQSNTAGKCFYTHLGMMDQRGCDDLRLRLGPASRASVMEGVLCV
ncbi:acyl-CoA N-acyltransferase [Boletus edulis]|uniref:N-alpha-acetyltransferase 60 n=1 Tax=Boletus edulis BED1 TaxID=1328754 RepID=A0AAD4GL24_BOLED|nr:acyl-CoA N-acyltransferase [Boletus edulis]KAF8448860.1 acyl-CoA N-acyltransferase [Boletus edulis BED1]